MADVRDAATAIYGASVGRAGGGKIVAVVSGGNIDGSRFASLVGACDNPDRAASAWR
jgi:threonine dehydratase